MLSALRTNRQLRPPVTVRDFRHVPTAILLRPNAGARVVGRGSDLVLPLCANIVGADETSGQRATAETAPEASRPGGVDPAPQYKVASGVSGTIKSVGSDTMNNLMTLWSEGFKRHYPSVRAEVEGKGSSTAPPALIAGTATFGP